jgi:DNA mismatch endonuclease (patch repair protein)
VEFWTNKINNNQTLDAKVTAKLVENGWQVLIVWECDLKNNESLIKSLVAFLGLPKSAE